MPNLLTYRAQAKQPGWKLRSPHNSPYPEGSKCVKRTQLVILRRSICNILTCGCGKPDFRKGGDGITCRLPLGCEIACRTGETYFETKSIRGGEKLVNTCLLAFQSLCNGRWKSCQDLLIGIFGSLRRGKDNGELIRRIKNGSYNTAPFEKSRLIPPFFRYKETFQVAPKYHLSSCIIEKVMSTITDAIFCYITNTSEFTANNRTISTEVYAQRFCVDRNVVLGFDSLQNVLGDSRVQYSIVRDPIDRFLSGFVDKCINEYGKEKTRCFGCNGDMRCFISRLYNLMITRQRENSTKYQYELAHFSPQTWYCNFKDHFDDYVIIRYKKGSHGVSKLADEIDSIFSRAHIPYHIRREIRDQLLGISLSSAGWTHPTSRLDQPVDESAQQRMGDHLWQLDFFSSVLSKKGISGARRSSLLSSLSEQI
ncbi:hypothetical protein Y032_0010g1125 [Ancylostoma ceylanicum]|nr:hypothetical protein Y032_0010g1125 [Ancylostoma ceylanicum]